MFYQLSDLSGREEILPLRKKITQCQTHHDPLLEKMKEWREKYEKAEKEITRLKDKNKQLEKEKGIETRN